MTAPLAPRAWSAETKRWWREFWVSEQGQKLPLSLHPTVSRLFGWYHRRAMLERRVDKLFETPRRVKGQLDDRLYAQGSMKQPVINPLVAELRSIEAQIEALERRVFGETATPATGGGSSDPAALLAAANARFAELAAGRETGDPDDPRLELLPGGKSATA